MRRLRKQMVVAAFLLVLVFITTYRVSATETLEAENTITFEDLAGLKGAVKDGSIQESVLAGLVKNPKIYGYQSLADECIALEQGKVDYVLVVKEQYSVIADLYDDLVLIPQLSTPCGEIGFIFAKNAKGDALRTQINRYLEEIRENGEMEALQDYWLNPGEKEAVDLPQEGENGVLKIASGCASPPFFYIIGEQYAGYEAALLAGFCREYGYGAKVVITNLGGTLSSVQTGKCDLAANSLMMTKERMEAVNFSEAIAQPMFMILMRSDTAEAIAGIKRVDAGDKKGFWGKLRAGFVKTFLVEKRWKMILRGCGVTLSLTFLVSVIGLLLGLQFYKVRVCKSAALRKLMAAFNSIMGGTPMVVLLLIFYYVIFGKVNVPAFFVAVVAFGLNFSSSISGIYESCIGKIDRSQMEAALALGYSQRAAFKRFILPQAMLQALPLMEGQIVSLLKGTSIVGFIALQDLTKMGDMIRSLTYEAFFPLLAVAVIYFFFAWLIKMGFCILIRNVDPVARRARRLKKQKEV